MGIEEDKEIQKTVEFALLQQRVDLLEKWRSGYEEAQNQKWENFDKKIDKFVENITLQITSLTTQLNDQKTNWTARVPWWLTTMITGLCSALVYMLTRK